MTSFGGSRGPFILVFKWSPGTKRKTSFLCSLLNCFLFKENFLYFVSKVNFFLMANRTTNPVNSSVYVHSPVNANTFDSNEFDSADYGFGTPYADQTNPYWNLVDMSKVDDYVNGNFWQQIGNWFDKSAQRNYELYLKALQWDQEYRDKVDSYKANSITTQVSQMEEAGINSDLNGVQPQSTSVDTPDYSTFNASDGSDAFLNTVGSVVSILSTVVSGGFAAAAAATQIAGNKLKNKGQQIANDVASLGRSSSEFAYFADYLLNTQDESTLKELINTNSDPDSPGISLKMNSSDFMAFSGLSQEQSDRILTDFGSRINTPAFRKRFASYLNDERHSSFGSQGVDADPLFSSDFGDDNMDVFKSTKQLYLDAVNTQNELNTIRNDFEKEFTSLLDASMSANAYNAEKLAEFVKANYSASYTSSLDASAAAGSQNAQNSYYSQLYSLMSPDMQAACDNAVAAINKSVAEYKSKLMDMANEYYDLNTTDSVSYGNAIYGLVVNGQLDNWANRLGNSFYNFIAGVIGNYYTIGNKIKSGFGDFIVNPVGSIFGNGSGN